MLIEDKILLAKQGEGLNITTFSFSNGEECLPLHQMLPVTLLHCEFDASEIINEPQRFWGTSVRGALGHVLKKQVCHNTALDCNSCFFNVKCVYPQLFSPNKNINKNTNSNKDEIAISAKVNTTAPSPMVISKAEFTSQHNSIQINYFGELQQSELKLMSNALSHLSLWGKKHYQLTLHAMYQTVPLFLHPVLTQKIKISFITPTQLKEHGKVLNHKTFTHLAFLKTLIRRFNTLCTLYGQQVTQTQSDIWYSAIDDIRCSNVELKQNHGWRYSTEQKKAIPLKGLVGEFTLSGRGLSALLPLITYGEHLHIGKGVFMGLGKYKVTNH